MANDREPRPPSPSDPKLPEGLRAVLFDVDDTLYDHAHAVRTALEALRRDEPLLARRPLDDVVREYGKLLEQVHPKVVAGSITPEDARAQRIHALYAWAGRELSTPAARERSEAYRDHYLRNQRAIDGALPLVRWLGSHARLAIVSNSRTDEQREKLRTIGMEGLFPTIVTSEAVGAAKPEAEIFRAALRALHIDAGEAVMVGDSWDADVLGARGCEIPVVWYNARALPIPDPSLAIELRAYAPLHQAVAAIAAASELEGDT